MWEKNIRNSAPVDSVIFLVGNKTDQIKKGKLHIKKEKIKLKNGECFLLKQEQKMEIRFIYYLRKISEAMVECIQNKPILNENEICSKLLGKYKEEEKIEISKKKLCCKIQLLIFLKVNIK